MSYKCHLCYSQPTNFTVSYPATAPFSCLPVCVYCVPPWVNSRNDGFWYEVKEKYGQHRPTPSELAAAMKQRYSPKPDLPIDEAVEDRCTGRKYREKYHIDELLSKWNELTRSYNFGHNEERPVWSEEKQEYYYATDVPKSNK